MLRHLHARKSAFALMCAWLAACNSAPPVEVGVDYITPRLSESDSLPEPEVPPLEDDGTADDDVIGQMDPILDFNDFIDSSVERGEVSPYCHSSFQECGGLLAGTWVVEDNCNPKITAHDVLQRWGKARMDLDETACWDAVQQMRWNWSGELRFEDGVAIDNRQRKQQVDMQLTARCLSATYGGDTEESVSPRICEGLQDDFTTCGVANGVCLCSNRTVSTGTASGVYGVLGSVVAIGTNPTARYAYCVDGDTLLWREQEGSQRHVVLRRTEAPPPGTTDPVELPR
ncbi:MAG TPA: hypothetical protein VMG12_05075 [Polyangiaceae bacterium]|nr:hypothetical protein [Polyangiaceae bacterium]